MTAGAKVSQTGDIGLRCHDVHQGMAHVDTRSADIAEIETTRMVGMAANLAVNIRGQDVIADGKALKRVAAQELGVDSIAFDRVVDLLQEADMVRVRQVGTKVQIDETVPHHENLYERLGEVWTDRDPSDIEHETVALVDALAHAPRSLDDVRASIPARDLKTILKIGAATELMKSLDLSDGTTLLYSPFFVFENPDAMKDIFEAHHRDDVQAVMAAIRGEQGIPVNPEGPALLDMVSRGLLMAPTISSAGGDASFAFLPYSVAPQYRGAKKAVLEKAIQILACVRYGQHRAVATRITSPGLILEALLDPTRNFTIKPHSEHKRQYQTLYRLQIVDFIKSGSWVAVRLIDTEDNKEAVRLALDLLRHGEQLDTRGLNEAAKELLVSGPGESYKNFLTTIHDRKQQIRLSADEWSDLTSAMRGGRVL